MTLHIYKKKKKILGMHRKSDLFLSGIQPVSGYSVVENARYLHFYPK